MRRRRSSSGPGGSGRNAHVAPRVQKTSQSSGFCTSECLKISGVAAQAHTPRAAACRGAPSLRITSQSPVSDRGKAAQKTTRATASCRVRSIGQSSHSSAPKGNETCRSLWVREKNRVFS